MRLHTQQALPQSIRGMFLGEKGPVQLLRQDIETKGGSEKEGQMIDLAKLIEGKRKAASESLFICDLCGQKAEVSARLVADGPRVWLCARCYWARSNSQPVPDERDRELVAAGVFVEPGTGGAP